MISFEKSEYKLNPNKVRGDEIKIKRSENLEDACEIQVALVPKAGSTFKFGENYSNRQFLVFEPGEDSLILPIDGITDTISEQKQLSLKIVASNNGESISKKAAILFLTPETRGRKPLKSVPAFEQRKTIKERIPASSAPTKITITDTTDNMIDAKQFKQLTDGLAAINSRLNKLEMDSKQEMDLSDNISDKVMEVDAQTETIQKSVNAVLAAMGIAIPAPVVPSASDKPASQASQIATELLKVLQAAGLVPGTTPGTSTATIKFADGSSQVVTIPPKPTCPTVPQVIYTQGPQPALNLSWSNCGTTPTNPGTPVADCGSVTAPKLVTFENGWRNTVDAQPFPNTYDKTGYYRDGNRIYLQGNVTGTDAQRENSNKTKIIFRIPTVCAPKTQKSFTVWGKTSNGGFESVELVLFPQPDGSAICYAQNEGILPDTITIEGSYLITA